MPKGKQQPSEIRIEWEYDKNYRLVPANGMWGGITPRGDLRIEFFVECSPVPGPGETLLIKEEGGFYQEDRERPERPALVRKIQVGVMVAPEHVSSFMEWFRAQAHRVQSSSKTNTEKVN